MYHVFRQQLVAATPAETWRALTDPARISEWFATTDHFALGERFRFDFGDGDYFAGEVVEWEEPCYLHMTWRFMELGPLFHIRLYLTPLAGETEVTVHDHGSLSLEEVESLRAGWTDFLARLHQHCATGGRARYLWSETIGIGALLAGAPDRWPPELDDPAFWKQAFPRAVVRAERRGEGELLLGFAEEGWQGAQTEALLNAAAIPGGTYLGLVHRGWQLLPEGLRIVERRRYAGRWRAALAALERKYGQGDAEAA